MKLPFVLFFSLITLLSYSQGFKSGVFAGLTASQIDGDELEGYSKVGIQAGIYSRYSFSEQWFSKLEIKFIQKGSLKSVKDNPQLNFKVKLNYLELPISLNYLYKEHFVFGIGLAYAQLLTAQVEDGAGVVDGNQLNYRDYDFNIIIPLQYFINEHLWADVRFAYSINSIKNDGFNKQWNNLLSLSIGYEF